MKVLKSHELKIFSFLSGLALEDVYIKRESEDTSYPGNHHGALVNPNIMGKYEGCGECDVLNR